MIINTNTPPNHPVDSFEVQVSGDWYQANYRALQNDYKYERTDEYGENVGRTFVFDFDRWVITRNVDGAPDGYSNHLDAETPWEAFPLSSYRNFKFTNDVDRTVNSARLGVASARLGEGITNTIVKTQDGVTESITVNR